MHTTDALRVTNDQRVMNYQRIRWQRTQGTQTLLNQRIWLQRMLRLSRSQRTKGEHRAYLVGTMNIQLRTPPRPFDHC
jgi:hypothetical protein